MYCNLVDAQGKKGKKQIPMAAKMAPADVKNLEDFFRKSQTRIMKSKEKVSGLIRERPEDQEGEPVMTIADMLADLDLGPNVEEAKAEIKQPKQTHLTFAKEPADVQPKSQETVDKENKPAEQQQETKGRVEISKKRNPVRACTVNVSYKVLQESDSEGDD